jgi:hypothetical protein
MIADLFELRFWINSDLPPIHPLLLTHEMCELTSTANNPQLSGLRLEVKIIRSSGKGCVCWFGVRRVIKVEGPSRLDMLALHFGVGFSPRKRRLRGNEID